MSSTSKIITTIVVVGAVIVGVILWTNREGQHASLQNQDSLTNQSKQTENSKDVTTKSSEAENTQAKELSFEETIPTQNWVLWRVTLNNKNVDMNVNVPQALTLQFDTKNKTVSGFSGCNSFSGPYIAGANNSFKFGALAATMKACAASMDLESSILSAMNNVTGAWMKGEQLVLDSKDSSTEIVYSQAK